jgi:hypothetical protein
MRDLRITIEATTSRPNELWDSHAQRISPQEEEFTATFSRMTGILHAVLEEMMHVGDTTGEVVVKLSIVREPIEYKPE